MNDLIKILIGNAGKQYVSSLIRYAPGLTAVMAPLVEKFGTCYAILPRDVAYGSALEFKYGGLLAEESPVNWLQRELDTRASKGRRGVIIVEDRQLGYSDYVDSLPKPHWFVVNEKMLIWAAFGPSESLDLQKLLREAGGFDSPAFVVKDAHIADALKRGNVDLQTIADCVTEVMAPAYDGESFVVWERHGSSS